MGSVKRDLTVNERMLEHTYALDNPKSVDLLLRHLPYMKERRFNGDYDASIVLLDLETAISNADLTDRQRQVLRLVFWDDLTQEMVGEKLGVRQHVINRHIKIAEIKIARVFESWARRGEGYKLTV